MESQECLCVSVYRVTIRRPDYWLPVWAWHVINMLFRRCHSCTHQCFSPLVLSSHSIHTPSPIWLSLTLPFFFSLSHNRWGEKESHHKKIFILRWLAFTVSPFKWYFHSRGTTFSPERISFWNVYLFEIGDDTNIFIPFHFFARRKGCVWTVAVNSQKINTIWLILIPIFPIFP